MSTTLEQLALKRDKALNAYTAVLKANRLSGHTDMGQIVALDYASTSAHTAWSDAYDESIGNKYADEEYSNCCGAEILMEDICAECKEHCEEFEEEE